MKVIVTKSAELRFRPLPGRDSADPFESTGETEDANLTLRVVKMSSDPARSAHVHPNSAEAVYVAAGRGTLWVEGERISIETGDTFLVPVGAKHATLPDPESEMKLICFFPHSDLTKNIEEIDGPIASGSS
jgi:quercetin dioxygenase-like cupin family protein